MNISLEPHHQILIQITRLINWPVRTIQPSTASVRRVISLSLGVAIGLIVYFTPRSNWQQDLIVFRSAVETLRHPYWARWLFGLLELPSQPLAFALLSLASTACLYAAVHIFKGQHWMVFISFPFSWTIAYGQVDGLVVGGLVLSWWALTRQRPILLGVGLLIASIKPQLSVPLLAILWWWSPSRLKSLLIPLLATGASLLQWGWWVPDWLYSLRETGDLVFLTRNLSLWPLIGPWILIIWPLIYALPLPRGHKLIAIAAGTAMSMPYFPLPSSVLILCMPVPAWTWIALQLPAFIHWSGFDIYPWLRVLPPLILLWAGWPAVEHIRKFLNSKLRTYHPI